MSRSTRRNAPLSQLTIRRTAVAALFILLFILASRISIDPDLWWHVRAGETTLSQGAPLMTDVFSFTRAGSHWVNHSWGSQILLALIKQAFGFQAMGFYTGIMAVLGMIFLYLCCEGNPFMKAFICFLAAAIASSYWSPRPQMVTFVLSAVVLYLLHLYKRRGVDRLWLIPPMIVVWVNLHAGFAAAFIFMGGFVVGEIGGKLLRVAEPQAMTWRQIGKVILVAVVSAFALLLNPNGATMWTYALQTASLQTLRTIIDEWQSLNFQTGDALFFVAMLFGTLAAVGYSGRRLDFTDLVLFSGTAFMAMNAVRNISLFALAAAPVLSRHVDSILIQRGWLQSKDRPVRVSQGILHLAMLLFLGLVGVVVIGRYISPQAISEANLPWLPEKATAQLKTLDPKKPMFNYYNFGGYLIYNAQDYPVFTDGRTDLYGDEFLLAHFRATSGIQWRQTFETWKIEIAFLETSSTLTEILREQPDWREVYSDDTATIFEKRVP